MSTTPYYAARNAFMRDRRGHPCKTEGCNRTITEKGSRLGLCVKCSQAHRRHGHVHQTMVTVAELKPFLRLMKAVRQRNKHVSWPALRSRWETLVEFCQREAYPTGIHNGHHRRAAALVLEIGEAVEPDRLIDLACAVYLLQASDPRRFKNDTCFDYALAHVLRRDAHAGRAFTVGPDGVKTHYRDLSRRTRKRLGELIRNGLGMIGLSVVKIEHDRLTEKMRKDAEFKDTLSAMA
jgi:hypothetical protein